MTLVVSGECLRSSPGMTERAGNRSPAQSTDQARGRAEVILGEKEREQLGGEVAHVLFVAVRRRHTEREGLRHARNVAAE
jgi:hypothetical protein